MFELQCGGIQAIGDYSNKVVSSGGISTGSEFHCLVEVDRCLTCFCSCESMISKMKILHV